LEEFLVPTLEEKCPDHTLFQQDGVPPHFHTEVMDFLNRKFPEKWIGTVRTIIWPPHYSPDLTPPAYMPPMATTLPELAERLQASMATLH
jgi:hypothetical protein